MVTITLLYLLGGFGRAGVGRSKFLFLDMFDLCKYIPKLSGSPASKFQSWAYGGYTPGGGIFASSTSAGMRGRTPTIYKAAAIVVASFAAMAVYRSWVAK
jgi:hypothetical protein